MHILHLYVRVWLYVHACMCVWVLAQGVALEGFIALMEGFGSQIPCKAH